MGLSDRTDGTERITDLERLLLLIVSVPVAVLGVGALLVPDQFAHLIGATGATSTLYLYRLVGAAGLGYVAALSWGLWTTIWASVRLLAASLLGFGASGAGGAVLQLLSGDTKGIVWVILVLGLAVSVLTTVLLIAHRGALRRQPNVSAGLVGFVVGATLVVLPFALVPLLSPTAFAQALGLPTVDLLLYRLGGAELVGYVVLGALEVQSRNAVELHPAAIMVLFFNGLAVLASLVALVAGERSFLTYLVVVASGTVAVVTVLALQRYTGGHLFRHEASLAS
jgi:hypothetical protein